MDEVMKKLEEMEKKFGGEGNIGGVEESKMADWTEVDRLIKKAEWGSNAHFVLEMEKLEKNKARETKAKEAVMIKIQRHEREFIDLVSASDKYELAKSCTDEDLHVLFNAQEKEEKQKKEKELSARKVFRPLTLVSSNIPASRHQRVKSFIEANRNVGTKKTYESGWKGFAKYLQVNGVKDADFTAVEIADYLRERMVEQNVAASTVSIDRAAIADKLRYSPREGMTSDPLVVGVMAVVKVHATQSKPKRHMSIELMRDIMAAHAAKKVDYTTPNFDVKMWREQRDVTLMLLMMLGMLRESEAVRLLDSDVIMKDEIVASKWVATLQLAIVQSKTDQAKNGALVLLATNEKELTLCPSAHVHKLRQLRMKVKGFDTEVKGYLFCKAEGGRLNDNTPCGIVQRAVHEANQRAETRGEGAEKWGTPREYGSHSLRRGGVTAARANGTSMLDIQRHGRWKSLVVFSYVGSSVEEQLAVSNNLLQAVRVVPRDDMPSAGVAHMMAAAASSPPSDLVVVSQLEAPHTPERTTAPKATSATKSAKRKRQVEGESEDEKPTEEEKEAELMEELLFDEAIQDSAEEEAVESSEHVEDEEPTEVIAPNSGRNKRRNRSRKAKKKPRTHE